MADTEIYYGYKVQDKISGFTGYVTLIGEHISGCTRYGVHPEGSDERPTKRGEQEFFFAEQLKVLETETPYTAFEVEEDAGFELGERVEDKITGDTGTALVINRKLWNCPVVCVDVEGQDGKEWIDSVRLERIDSGKNNVVRDIQQKETKSTGPIEDCSNPSLSRN